MPKIFMNKSYSLKKSHSTICLLKIFFFGSSNVKLLIMNNKNYGFFLFCMLTLFNCGAVLLLFGFFPDASNTLNVVKKYEKHRPTEVDGISITPPQQKYKQIILFIIDALRFNFMNMTEHIPFMHSKNCSTIKLEVAPPTVTMPRIKSLIAGKPSSFIDLIKNLGEAEQLTDSIIHELKRHGKMINFGGDKTWTQLFPTEFTRKKANNDSLFVNDFYEGDKKVQETLKQEIIQTDWSFLILHFLGLDHIGHVEGSNSVKIPSKLLEMDEIIREINENSLFKDRLLLVTGDHGMRNGGGHGGSTEEEIKVPLLVFADNCHKNIYPPKMYNQIDMTPTLAILFSVEIPQTSIGCLMPELLFNFTFEEKLYAFYYNAQHLLNKTIAKYGQQDAEESNYLTWNRNAMRAHRQFLESKMKNNPAVFHYEQALADYKRLAAHISSRLAESLITFDLTLITVGILLTTSVTIYMIIYMLLSERNLIQWHKIFNKGLIFISFLLGLIIVIAMSWHPVDSILPVVLKKHCLCIPFIAASICITFNIFKTLQKLLLPIEYSCGFRVIWCFPIPLVLCYFLSVILLISSSYIEFEERSSHYLGSTCLILLIGQMILQRISSEFSTLGNGKPSIPSVIRNSKSDFIVSLILVSTLRIFRKPQNIFFNDLEGYDLLKKSLLVLNCPLGLLYLFAQLSNLLTITQRVPCALAVYLILSFRIIEGKIPLIPDFKISPFFVLMLFWLCATIMIVMEFKSYLKRDGLKNFLSTIIASILLIGALLQKPQNVMLLPSLLFLLDKIYLICDNLKLKMPQQFKRKYLLAYKMLMTFFLAKMFFFYQGNTNSLSTIDLNPGFIGQSGYNPIIAAVFLTLNTYTAPIAAFLYLVLHVLQKNIGVGTSSNVNIYTNSPLDGIEDDVRHVLTLYSTAVMLPTSVYLGLMILFRYHLFIYSVFAPKFFYECYEVIVFYIVYIFIYVVFVVFKKFS